MRRHLVWLVTLPLALAGTETAHAVANALVGGSDGELFASPASGSESLPFVVAGVVALVLVMLVARVRGTWWESTRAPSVALPFGVLPLVAFALLEVAEGIAEHHSLRGIVGATFAVGLALQVPVGVAGYVLACGLLRLSDGVRELVYGRRPVSVKAAREKAPRPPQPLLRRPVACSGKSRGRAPPVVVGHTG